MGTRFKHYLETLERYPNCKMVGNATTFRMFEQFYNTPKTRPILHCKRRRRNLPWVNILVSYTMPMVHWPEVTCTYEKSTGTLFSADAFGTFGTVNGNIVADQTDYVATYEEEARRYYTNIKYGPSKKMQSVKFLVLISNALLPLHGPIWRTPESIHYILHKYLHWSSYTAEQKGVIAFGSMYGNTVLLLNN